MSLPTIELDESKNRHQYKLDGEKMPSVTQIIDAFDPKPALTWWAWRVGMSTIIELLQSERLSYPVLIQENPSVIRKPIKDDDLLLERLAIETKFHPNAIRDERKDEGVAIHHALHQAAERATIPILSDFDPHLRGYVQSFSTWFVDTDPDVIATEVLTGSPLHRYCGKFDIKYRPGQGYARVELGDFKTQDKPELSVYDSHHHQLRGYLEAEAELSRMQNVDEVDIAEIGRIIVLSATGDRPLVVASATPAEHWFNLVRAWYSRQDFLAAKRDKGGQHE